MDGTNMTSTTSREMLVNGIIHLLLGSLFLIVKPYQKMCMNHTDGLIFTTVGVLLFLVIINTKLYYIMELTIGVIGTVGVLLFLVIINTKPYYIMELTVGVIGTVFITVYIIHEHIK